MPDDHLLYHVENNAAHITINREQQRNAITPEAIHLFLEYLDRAEKDADVRAVLVTGAGEKAFCTGRPAGRRPIHRRQEGVCQYAQLLKRLTSFPEAYCCPG